MDFGKTSMPHPARPGRNVEMVLFRGANRVLRDGKACRQAPSSSRRRVCRYKVAIWEDGSEATDEEATADQRSGHDHEPPNGLIGERIVPEENCIPVRVVQVPVYTLEGIFLVTPSRHLATPWSCSDGW